MTKNLRISVSQVKTYMKSPAEWAWQKILWIYTKLVNSSITSWSAFHKVRETNNKADWMLIIHQADESIKEEAIEKFNNLEDNYERLCRLVDVPTSIKNEEEFNVDIFDNWIFWKGYIDWQTEDAVIEYKSSSSLSEQDSNVAMRQAENNWDQYEFQAWIYMRATGKKKCYIIEVLNKDTTITEKTRIKKDDLISLCENFQEGDEKLTMAKIVAKYEPRKNPWQVITFTMDKKFDKRMTDKYMPIINEMKDLFNKHSK